MTDVVLVERHDAVALVTLNRPESRNALNGPLLAALHSTMGELGGEDGLAAIVLTGADPAFCAGVDLKELGSGARIIGGNRPAGDPAAEPRVARPWPEIGVPVIGAINGPAVTGGLEIALQCDWLIASERARFADTHARVGVMPGWGLTVLLPQAVGVRLAREMSLTGNFLDAAGAHRAGLVNHVVPHAELVPRALALAADVAGNELRGTRAMLGAYRLTTTTTAAEGLKVEARLAAAQHGEIDPAEVERRRGAIVERGRSQL